MPAEYEVQLAMLEKEELLDEQAHDDEVVRAQQVAKRQVDIEEQDRKAADWREAMSRKRVDLKARFEALEERRKARMQYYRAKLYHSRRQGESKDDAVEDEIKADDNKLAGTEE